ncbi:MAG: hypothetical protein Q4E61_03955, partial [Alphaproteobacteria bacterium]|nr:hypothetical protein [Alphaproteobacteria bacterium]
MGIIHIIYAIISVFLDVMAILYAKEAIKAKDDYKKSKIFIGILIPAMVIFINIWAIFVAEVEWWKILIEIACAALYVFFIFPKSKERYQEKHKEEIEDEGRIQRAPEGQGFVSNHKVSTVLIIIIGAAFVIGMITLL